LGGIETDGFAGLQRFDVESRFGADCPTVPGRTRCDGLDARMVPCV